MGINFLISPFWIFIAAIVFICLIEVIAFIILVNQFNRQNLGQQNTLNEFKETIQQAFYTHQSKWDERQLSQLNIIQETLQKTSFLLRQEMSEKVDRLTQSTDQRLKEISGQVEKRLSDGFEKTAATFTDIVKRLALIDEAQKKMSELSANVVNLQSVLSDKRSRGAFGEVQLSSLIRNMLPENSFELQYSLPNGKRVDCMLFLPKPTGNIAIDAKFPLEAYQKIIDLNLPHAERVAAESLFRQNVKKHIQDIAEKYIIPGTTSDGAVMFIPAEAVFAEIHAHFPDLVELAQKMRVWMVSPTTMMAILTTIRAVLKDEATRQQAHIIQEHLQKLSKEFERFQGRMENLAKHIHQAHEDAAEVNTSAGKICAQFKKIDQVELEESENLELPAA